MLWFEKAKEKMQDASFKLKGDSFPLNKERKEKHMLRLLKAVGRKNFNPWNYN